MLSGRAESYQMADEVQGWGASTSISSSPPQPLVTAWHPHSGKLSTPSPQHQLDLCPAHAAGSLLALEPRLSGKCLCSFALVARREIVCAQQLGLFILS